MQTLWYGRYYEAVLVEAQRYLELTQNVLIIAMTIALIVALWALVKGA